MTWEAIESGWEDVIVRARAKWAKLTDEDLRQTGGDRGLLVTKLRALYGMRREEAERDLDNFARSLQ